MESYFTDTESPSKILMPTTIVKSCPPPPPPRGNRAANGILEKPMKKFFRKKDYASHRGGKFEQKLGVIDLTALGIGINALVYKEAQI